MVPELKYLGSITLENYESQEDLREGLEKITSTYYSSILNLNELYLKDKRLNFGHDFYDYQEFYTSGMQFFIRQARPEQLFYVDISMDDTVIEHERNVYNSLDFIGDIGGFNDGLSFIFKVLMYIFGWLGFKPL